MSKRTFIVGTARVLDHLGQELAAYMRDGLVMKVEVSEYKATRSVEQNARMWAMLTEVSEQVEWYGVKLSPEEWKDVFTASLRKQRAVPNLDGTGFVVLGLHTSKMSIGEMGDLMTLMEAFGAERGVQFRQAA